MITKYSISKDDKYYRAFTDLIRVKDRLICSFCEINNDTKEFNICISESFDDGKNWSDRKIIQEKIGDNGRWDCPRLCKLNDDSIILIGTWYLNDDKTKKVDVIDRSIVTEFIDNIFINDDGDIKIVFKSNNEYIETIKFLKTHNYVTF